MIESTIILERSGLALRMAGRGDAEYTAHGFSLRLPSNGETRHAVCAPGQGRPFYSDRATCLAWLDARALELRAALLPPGAIVVSDTEETRERIARKLNATHREFAQTPNSLCYDCDCPDQDDNAPPPFDEMCDGCKSSQMEEASAVLAALRESRP